MSTLGRAPQRSDCRVGQSPEMGGQLVLEISAGVIGGRVASQWRALASSKVCGKSRSGRAFWPCLDSMDSVCSRTASVEWNGPGKYGPHGELFFFLIQKKPATDQVGETCSSFFNADICTSSLLSLPSADVLKKCALLALHIIAEEGRDGDEFQVPGLGGEWKMGCPRSPMRESEGEARGVKMRLLPLVKAMSAMMRCTSSGCMGPLTRSLFSCRTGSWQRWHLSCHMALDMLCQEMHEAWSMLWPDEPCVKEW